LVGLLISVALTRKRLFLINQFKQQKKKNSLVSALKKVRPLFFSSVICQPETEKRFGQNKPFWR
jgi:hypothetical protein